MPNGGVMAMTINKETLKPLIEKINQELNVTLEKRFPKEKREEIMNRARQFAEKSKGSPLVLNYLRPLVGSEKATEVLASLELRVSSAAPVVKKLQALRKQFMDLTEPQHTETPNGKDVAQPKKKRSKKVEKSDDL